MDLVFSKENCYTLGFLWADGCVRKGNRREVSISLIEDDMSAVKDIFFCFTDWKIYLKKGIGGKRRDQIYLYKHCGELSNFLKNLDYSQKSIVGADKVFSIIPDDLKKYFLRGYFDGDGCLYFRMKPRKQRLTFSGSYEQDWKWIENYLKSYSVSYKIDRRMRKNENDYVYGKGSDLLIRKKDDIYKMYQLLYEPFDFGLKRKHNKFLEFLEVYDKKRV